MFLIACNPPTVDLEKNSQLSEPSKQNNSKRLAEFFEQSYQQDLERSPMTQSYRGIKWDYDKWDDVSEDKINQDIQLAQERLAEIDTFNFKQLKDNEKTQFRII